MISKLKKKFFSRDGMASPLKVVIVIIIIILAALLFEVIRLMIVLRGVEVNIEDATHRVIIENYESVISQLREGGASAYTYDAGVENFVENVTPYEIMRELENELDLIRDGSKYISYAGAAKEFEISDVTVTVSNPELLETTVYGETGGKMSALISAKCTVYWHMPFDGLPGFSVTIRKEAGFINKF
jgi:hypothetical protein